MEGGHRMCLERTDGPVDGTNPNSVMGFAVHSNVVIQVARSQRNEQMGRNKARVF